MLIFGRIYKQKEVGRNRDMGCGAGDPPCTNKLHYIMVAGVA
jgi:hypothetical protein